LTIISSNNTGCSFFLWFVVKVKRVELESISSQIQSSGKSKSQKSEEEEDCLEKATQPKRTKRGRPKSERKELDKELYNSLKDTDHIENDNEQTLRHEFQKSKLEKFKKGRSNTRSHKIHHLMFQYRSSIYGFIDLSALCVNFR